MIKQINIPVLSIQESLVTVVVYVVLKAKNSKFSIEDKLLLELTYYIQ